MSGDYGFARPDAVERKEQDVSTCATCRHWTWDGIEPTDGSRRGTCRGGPPVVFLINGAITSVFPTTPEWETCGAYSPRVPDEDAT